MLQKFQNVTFVCGRACAEAVSLLQMNEEGSMLRNDEGMLSKEIMSDGDTRGDTKFVNRQLETTGSNVHDKESLIPGIGHFIKFLSNVFCAFNDKNSKFSGVSLLDPNRIRAISSNSSNHLKSHDEFYKPNSNLEHIISLQNTCL